MIRNTMNPKFLVSTLATAVALSFSATAIAKDTSNKEQRFEQITVIGSQQAINDIPGSATFISEEDLQILEEEWEIDLEVQKNRGLI